MPSFPGSPRPDVILLVDDDAEVRMSLRRMIARHLPDVEVLLAVDGDDALRVLREREVDLVVTDQRMPKITGVELLARIEQQGYDVARVVLTGYASIDVVQRAVNEGHVDAFLQKPVDSFAFKERLRVLLDDHRARKARQTAFERAGAKLRSS